MARGRMINRKVAMSTKLAHYGDRFGAWALVFHHRLLAFLDKNGNCRADAYWLKAETMPRVDDVTPDMCRKYVAGLVEVGLAVTYEIDGMTYLHMPGFRGEQVGLRHDRETREVPVPFGFDEETGSWPEPFRKASGNNPADFRKVAGNIPAEGEVEGEREEPRRQG